MSPHDSPFELVQRSGLQQNMVRNADLADVMQQGSPFDLKQRLSLDPHLLGQFHGRNSDPA